MREELAEEELVAGRRENVVGAVAEAIVARRRERKRVIECVDVKWEVYKRERERRRMI